MSAPTYLPLNAAKQEIRLIEIDPELGEGDIIHCSLTVVSLDDDPTFTAISYIWVDPKHTTNIVVNGDQVEIPSSAVINLRILRKAWNSPSSRFWIDAICIHQTDTEERNQQVQLMGAIYSTATRVLACLLPGDLDLLDPAISAIQTIARICDREELCLHQSSASLQNATRAKLLNILSLIDEELPREAYTYIPVLGVLPYWSRTWIVQEVLLAQDVSFLCGNKVLSKHDFECMTALVMATSDLEGHDNYFFRMRQEWFVLPLVQFMIFWSTHKSRMIEDRGKPFMHWLRLTWKSSATNERDKVYDLLGLLKAADSQIRIVPNYVGSVADVYTQLMWSLVARYGKLYLNGCHGISPLSQDPIPNLPSWCMDLRGPPDFVKPSKPILGEYEWCASGSYRCDIKNTSNPRILNAMAIVVSSVKKVAHATIRPIPRPSTDTVYKEGDTSTEGEEPSPSEVDYQDVRNSWADVVESVKGVFHPRGWTNWCAFFRIVFRKYYDAASDSPETQKLIVEMVLCFWLNEKPFLMSAKGAVETFKEQLYFRNRVLQTIALRRLYDQFLQERPGLVVTMLSLGLESELLQILLGDSSEWPPDPFHDWNADVAGLLSGVQMSQTELDHESGNGFEFLQAIRRGESFSTYQKCILELYGSGQLFTTENGYIGITHAPLQLSDQICIVLGCDVPLVIRSRGDHFIVLGSCYVPGLMYGEAMSDLEQGRHVQQLLSFC